MKRTRTKTGRSRNNVVLDKGTIVKSVASRGNATLEAKMLDKLRMEGVAVPSVVKVDGHRISMGYIDGPTYDELIDTLTEEQAIALADWLESFYRATGKIRGDTNLSNYLWDGSRCVGIDFEAAKGLPLPEGERESDFGRILAFAVTYTPRFAREKEKAARLLLRAFLSRGADLSKIAQEYLEGLGEQVRRGRITRSELCKGRQFWSVLVGREQRSAFDAGLLEEWCRCLGVSDIGDRFLNARVVDKDERSVYFVVDSLEESESILQVLVEESSRAEKAFFRCGNFAVFYSKEKGAALSRQEKAFLEQLRIRMYERVEAG